MFVQSVWLLCAYHVTGFKPASAAAGAHSAKEAKITQAIKRVSAAVVEIASASSLPDDATPTPGAAVYGLGVLVASAWVLFASEYARNVGVTYVLRL